MFRSRGGAGFSGGHREKLIETISSALLQEELDFGRRSVQVASLRKDSADDGSMRFAIGLIVLVSVDRAIIVVLLLAVSAFPFTLSIVEAHVGSRVRAVLTSALSRRWKGNGELTTYNLYLLALQ